MVGSPIPPPSFGAFPSNIEAGQPVELRYQTTEPPLKLTLCLSRSQGHPPLSVIASALPNNAYTWTPSDSLLSGNYSLELSQETGEQTWSGDFTIYRGETELDSSRISSSGTAFASSTRSTATASSIQSSGILASGQGSSLAPLTAKATLLGTTTTTPPRSPQSPDVQHLPALQHPISNGAIAGIVVGVVVFILLVTASVLLCWRRRRRTSQTAVSELPDHRRNADIKSDPSATIWIPELDQEGAVYGPHELADTATPLQEPRKSLGATEPCFVEGRAFEMANPD